MNTISVLKKTGYSEIWNQQAINRSKIEETFLNIYKNYKTDVLSSAKLWNKLLSINILNKKTLEHKKTTKYKFTNLKKKIVRQANILNNILAVKTPGLSYI